MQIGTASSIPRPATLHELFESFRTVLAAKPVLVWYNADGERIELSGRVFHNWVSKSANLITQHTENPDAPHLTLDAPVHWKSLALAFAAWTANFSLNIEAEVESASAHLEPDILATSRSLDDGWRDLQGHRESDYAAVIRLDTTNLGTAFGGDLHVMDIDFAQEIRLEADDFTPHRRSSLSLDELIESLERAAPQAGKATGGEHAVVLLDGIDAERNPRHLSAALSRALSVWARGGTLVLVQAGTEDVERVARAELADTRITL
ncbi:TIGR03089 family protein [Haematomicrobium sanguinis]|uniref:TIGR03089 family protein n=1 Tax=Haematomicrobium sanguinis TaxID=479106 RepID=UPI00047AB6E4|nr:TIGR03089 family protein [Haematomicrobium sanguinis]